jgi:hypothetical protein
VVVRAVDNLQQRLHERVERLAVSAAKLGAV